jgi:hypothetical protein
VFSVRKRLAHFLELRRGCFALHNSKKDPMSSPLIQGHSWTGGRQIAWLFSVKDAAILDHRPDTILP